jgi:hypothetical protein
LANVEEVEQKEELGLRLGTNRGGDKEVIIPISIVHGRS